MIDAQREVHVVQQTRHRVGTDGEAQFAEPLCNLLGGTVSPLQSGHGIAGGIVLQQPFDGVN